MSFICTVIPAPSDAGKQRTNLLVLSWKEPPGLQQGISSLLCCEGAIHTPDCQGHKQSGMLARLQILQALPVTQSAATTLPHCKFATVVIMFQCCTNTHPANKGTYTQTTVSSDHPVQVQKYHWHQSSQASSDGVCAGRNPLRFD